MSAPHGCNNDKDVVESFKEALKQRVGADRYQMWFVNGVEFVIDDQIDAKEDDARKSNKSICHGRVLVRVRGQFALDRIRKNFLRELRGAAMQACGATTEVQLCLDAPLPLQADLPLSERDSDWNPEAEGRTAEREQTERDAAKQGSRKAAARGSRKPTGRGKTESLSNLVAKGAGAVRGKRKKQPASPQQLALPNLVGDNDKAVEPGASGKGNVSNPQASEGGSDQLVTSVPPTAANFVVGPSNQLAHTAMAMVCQDPSSASPLFVFGPTGTGKTHMLKAIADQLRRRHRLRRVMHLSGEQFTNDFISSVGNSGITAFRRRYREVDALLIDDVQFLGSKQATLREMLYTVETLADAGRPLVFSGLQSPTDIPGLSQELAGRLAAGLVCPIQPLDVATREVILRRWIDQRCPFALPDVMIDQICPILAGDGRVISGIVNLINTIERMYERVPTMDELRQFGGELLRAARPVATLSVIEMAVCDAFRLEGDTLRGGSQTRAVTEPRMLAMYLSRQLTSSAYTEIARHFGGKSHSTAIQAEKNVKSWLDNGKTIGRGQAAMSAQEAIDRVERALRTG